MSEVNSRNCPKRKVRDVTSNTEILSATNPEIFDTSPRPGGFLKILVPTKSQDYIAVSDVPTCDALNSSVGVSFEDRTAPSSRSSRSKKSFVSIISTTTKAPHKHIAKIVPETPSREFRLSRAIMETDWDITAVDETHTVVDISNSIQDSINMLAITITTVMLLAAKLDITEEYLTWAEEYLVCFKDENGMYPPNIDGILTEISKKRCECPKKCVDEIEECEPDDSSKKNVKTKPSNDTKTESTPKPSSKSPSRSPSSQKSKSSSKSPPKSPSLKKGSSSPNELPPEEENSAKSEK